MTTAHSERTLDMDFLTRCERCNRDRTLNRMRLIGGYNVVLCTQCENDWHFFITAKPEWTEKISIESRHEAIGLRATAGVASSEDDVAALTTDYDSMLKRLFGIATEWMAEPGPKRE